MSPGMGAPLQPATGAAPSGGLIAENRMGEGPCLLNSYCVPQAFHSSECSQSPTEHVLRRCEPILFPPILQVEMILRRQVTSPGSPWANPGLLGLMPAWCLRHLPSPLARDLGPLL